MLDLWKDNKNDGEGDAKMLLLTLKKNQKFNDCIVLIKELENGKSTSTILIKID